MKLEFNLFSKPDLIIIIKNCMTVPTVLYKKLKPFIHNLFFLVTLIVFRLFLILVMYITKTMLNKNISAPRIMCVCVLFFSHACQMFMPVCVVFYIHTYLI